MDYGSVLKRAWTIVQENPYLLILGIIIALTGSNAGSGSSYSVSDEQMGEVFGGAPIAEQFEAWMGVAMAAIVGLICLAFLVFLVLWLVAQVARGGLIAGVDTIEEGRSTSFVDSWRAGWARKWTLLGIGLVLLIPFLLLALVGVGGFFLLFGEAIRSGDAFSPGIFFGGGIAAIIGVLCLIIPVALFVGLWSEFAYRAAMLEGTGVLESFGRGWNVLFDNIGPVIVFVLIRLAIGIVLFLPTAIVSLCCLLWPILLVLQGAVTTYFSTVWTLAWREFTGTASAEPPDEALEPLP